MQVVPFNPSSHPHHCPGTSLSLVRFGWGNASVTDQQSLLLSPCVEQEAKCSLTFPSPLHFTASPSISQGGCVHRTTWHDAWESIAPCWDRRKAIAIVIITSECLNISSLRMVCFPSIYILPYCFFFSITHLERVEINTWQFSIF